DHVRLRGDRLGAGAGALSRRPARRCRLRRFVVRMGRPTRHAGRILIRPRRPSMAYTLAQFVADLDRITRTESDATVITERVAPLLGELIKNPEAVPAEYRNAPDGQRGRYLLHRAPQFNVSAVIWRAGDRAGAHNHETW